jgi:DNA (cytosine-5)-methyltransferase 1
MPRKLTYIDLFAGCGGLSVGLEKTGFHLELAVEKSDMAAETFYHNFIAPIRKNEEWNFYRALPLKEQVPCKLVVKELRALLDDRQVMAELKHRDIDLVAGGPPCQGFSMAGRRDPRDKRNQLPWQFLEFVEVLSPKAVIIENVVGMRQDFQKHNKGAPFEELQIALAETGHGYVVQSVQLNAKHFGVPQHRPRLMILALRKDIANLLPVKLFPDLWKSDYDFVPDLFLQRPSLAPVASFNSDKIRTVKHALWDIADEGYSVADSDERYNEEDGQLARCLRAEFSWIPRHLRSSQDSRCLPNHALRSHTDTTVLRFRLYQYFRDAGLPPRILHIAATSGKTKQGILLLSNCLRGARLPAIAPDGTILARNKKELLQLTVRMATRKHSQRPLDWNSPSPTILSLPDDFVHPSVPRTLTVRELARLQSFPDSFEFRAKETTGSLRRRFEIPQYTQVGNAVPPLIGEALGKVFAKFLRQSERRMALATAKRPKELVQLTLRV